MTLPHRAGDDGAMKEKESPALSDPATFPAEEVLSAVLGSSKTAFDAMLERLAAIAPDASSGWKYYRDGKSWLMNASRKKKTLFWLSADRGSFRATFYLPTALEDAVLGGPFPEALKEGFAATAGKKFRGATLTIRAAEDLVHFEALVALKLTVL